MSRATRLQPVRNLADDAERKAALRVAAAERVQHEAEGKLADLERYADDYQRQYTDRVANGIGVTELRDYQAFLARLAEAVRQQRAIVSRTQHDCAAERLRWQEAAKRSKALDHVADQWRNEERCAADRQEQREIDERALRGRVER
ncbi:flagellar export protein FliJ [Povalibacter sp.]|uniref:flagellar export protein FliJ n=1 Tax=Povalibacter sp. TaxID=1962978 RepID=UPI002F418539